MKTAEDNPSIGSDVDAFLQEEGIYEECHNKAIKEVLAWQIMLSANRFDRRPYLTG